MSIDFLISGIPMRLFHFIHGIWVFVWLYTLESYIAFKIDETRK